MKSHRFWIIALAAAICLAPLVSVRADPAGKDRPTTIAVVDVESVLGKLKEKTAVEAELRSREQTIATEVTTKQQDIKNLRNDLEILSTANPGFGAKQDELEQKVFELRAWTEMEQNKLKRDSRLQVARLYNKILACVGKIATEQGYALVLFKEPAPELRGVNPEELSSILRGRKVLWSDSKLDLTEQVIQAMNNEYANNVGLPMTPTTQPTPK